VSLFYPPPLVLGPTVDELWKLRHTSVSITSLVPYRTAPVSIYSC